MILKVLKRNYTTIRAVNEGDDSVLRITNKMRGGAPRSMRESTESLHGLWEQSGREDANLAVVGGSVFNKLAAPS